MAEIKFDSELVSQCKAQFANARWELPGACTSDDTAAIAVRTVLALAGERDLLARQGSKKADGKEYTAEEIKFAVETRKTMVAAIKPIFDAGAPVNFKRGALVKMQIAPKTVEKEETEKLV